MAKKKNSNGFLPNVETASATMGKVMDRVLISKETPVDLRELAIEFMKEIGGPQEFVQLMMLDYHRAKPGSPERARVWELLVKLFGIATEKEPAMDGDLASDADLENAASDLMKRMGADKETYPDHVCI